jgi:hypothetical protein
MKQQDVFSVADRIFDIADSEHGTYASGIKRIRGHGGNTVEKSIDYFTLSALLPFTPPYVFSSHGGYTDDFNKAFENWNDQTK